MLAIGLVTDYLSTPLGRLRVVSEAGYLTYIDWSSKYQKKSVKHASTSKNKVARQLAGYFEAKRKVFSLPVSPQGTAFQKKVWTELIKIPCGTTVSYGELARRIGCPTAFRAVAGACGANPLMIVVPCHRVIASDGSLGGYAYGLKKKKYLLRLEKAALREL